MSAIKSSSLITKIPSSFKSLVVTPSPLIIFLLKLPSYIFPHPQEGLYCFKIALFIPRSLAIYRVSFAPWIKFWVTSLPDLVKTFVPIISAHSRGVGRPPSCSGQRGIKI